jgi:hypothetical protein
LDNSTNRALSQANADVCSGRLRIGFTGNFSFGDQLIVKVVTVLATTLLIY